ncbi:MAG: ABC transporter substrate-binding protein [Thermomicrobiales bacterium]
MSSYDTRETLPGGRVNRRTLVQGAAALGAAGMMRSRSRRVSAQDATTVAGYEWQSVGARTVEGAEQTFEFADRQVLLSQAGEAELEFWTINLKGPYGTWIESFLEDYQSVNEGVSIQWVDVPGAEVAQKYLSALSAGEAPDLANTYEMPRFIELGALANIGEYLPAENASEFYEGFLAGLTFNDQLYGFPWYASTGGLIYSRRLLEEAGADPDAPPTTWDEAMALSRTIKDATGKYGLLMAVGQGELVQLLQQEGVPLVSEDRTMAALNTPEAVELFAKWQAFYQEGYLPPEGTTVNPRDANEWYYAERGAMVPSNAVVIVRRADPAVIEGLDTDVASSLKGASGQSITTVQYFVVAANAENLQAAVDFGAYVTGTGMQIEFITQVPILPSRASVSEDPEFKANFIDKEATGRSQQELLDRGFKLQLADLENAVLDFNATPTVVGWARMYDLFKQETNKMFATDQSAEDTLATIETGWNEILAEGA